MSVTVKGTDPKAMLQDLKGNRRLQVALGLLVVMIWYLWPSAPTPRAVAGRRANAPLGDRQTRELQKLPDLAKLDKAGELPSEARMFRDLFLFDGPPPPPPPPVKPPPPPPPPTPEQIAAQKLAADRARETASKPTNLRYLGYLGSKASGRLGAFMKGEDPVTLKPGELVNPQWRLVAVSDVAAEFQNVKFADIKHKIEAVETRGPAGHGPVNEF